MAGGNDAEATRETSSAARAGEELDTGAAGAGLRIDDVRSVFQRVPGYLNVATRGLPSDAVLRVLSDELASWRLGETGPRSMESIIDGARAKYARLVGVEKEAVSVGSQVSVATGLLAANVGTLDAGDEVLCAEADFGSVMFPFLTQAESSGYTVRTVPLESVVESIRDRTAVVAVSAVQSADGRVIDLAALRDAARRHGAWTLVDTTQAVGWMPFGTGDPVSAADFDMTVTGAFKWLCSPRGATMTSLSPRAVERLRPVNTSWYSGEDVWNSTYGPAITLAASARRFDVSPVSAALTGLEAALDTFTPESVRLIREWDLALAGRFCAGIGLPEPVSPIVSVPDPEGSIVRSAEQHGLKISARAGMARFAFHVFNDPEDAEAAISAVSAARS